MNDKLNTETMDRRDEITGGSARTHGRDPCLHLLRGLVGEGHAENVRLGNAHSLKKIGVALGQGPGFAGTSSGYDSDGALSAFYGFHLFYVQLIIHVAFYLARTNISPACAKVGYKRTGIILLSLGE